MEEKELASMVEAIGNADDEAIRKIFDALNYEDVRKLEMTLNRQNETSVEGILEISREQFLLEFDIAQKGRIIFQLTVSDSLTRTIESARYDLIESLVKSRRVDLNVLTAGSQTPLHLLCLNSKYENKSKCHENYRIAKLLLEYGVGYHHKDNAGKTPLMLACQNGYTSVICALLDWVHSRSADLVLDAVDSSGKTALTMAAESGNSAIFCLLTCETFLQKVAFGSSREMSSRCSDVQCAHPETDCPNKNFISFSDYLKDNPSKGVFASCAILDWFFKAKKAISHATCNGWNILHEAMSQCQGQFQETHLEAVEILLISEEFDVNAKTNESETVLHLLCRCSPYDKKIEWKLEKIIEILFDLRVECNQRNVSGQTALMIACEKNNLVVVRQLLKWREINLKNYKRNELNAYELIAGWEDVTWHKVDINITDNDGQMALSIAKLFQNAEIVSMLEEVSFLEAVANGEIETVKVYLNFTNDEIDQQYEVYRRTDEPPAKPDHKSAEFSMNSLITYSVWLEAVWIAQKKSFNDIYKLLIEDDRYTKSCNEQQTVLHMAMKEYLEIEHLDHNGKSKAFNKLEILLRSGKCDVYILNFQKQTVLHMICCKRPGDYSSSRKFSLSHKYDECNRDKHLVELILEQKFDVNGKDADEKTALMLACENQNVKILWHLLNVSKQKGIRLDFDDVDSAGETALSGAFKRRDRCIAEVLFEARLLAAVEDKKKDVVKSLLDYLVYGKENNTSEMVIIRSSCPGFHKERNPSYSPLFEIDLNFWTEAVIVANSKSEAIVSLLLDYGENVYGLDCKDSNSLLERLVHPRERIQFNTQIRNYVCAIEILLNSLRVNVNTLNSRAETPLHSVLGNYPPLWFLEDPSLFENGISRDAISLLLCHGANVNAKDNRGKTVLAIASEIGSVSILRTILDCANADLDAKDLKGRTPLIKAAKWKIPGAVEILLDAGASVNVSDNRGFTALHYALFEIPNPFLWAIFGNVAKGYTKLGERKEIIDALFNSQKPHECYRRDRKELNTDKILTVDVLLKCSKLNVNALDYEGYSPLDIAELSIPELPSSIKDSLKQKGAKLSVFKSKYLQPFNNLDFLLRKTDDYTSKVFSAHQTQTNTALTELSQATMKHLVSPRDEKLRTPLHHATISQQKSLNSIHEFDCILKTLISFGCNVNDIDIYGRTPLHYAETKEIASILLNHRPDETITDKDGIRAVDMTDMLNEMYYKWDKTSSMRSFFEHYLNVIETDFQRNSNHGDNSRPMRYRDLANSLMIAEKVWETGEYAFRHPMVNKVTDEVINFIENLASEIQKLDPKFEIKPIFVGSSYEGTKINYPNEFDFDVLLTKFSQLCSVSQSPELPTGFCHLKQKNGTQDDGFESFFDDNGILITERINTRFKLLLNNVLTDDRFILRHWNFDWSKCPIENVKSMFHVDVSLAATLKLTRTRLGPNDKSDFNKISIDIVPCIHIDGWWPDEAISNVSEEIKAIGCNFVFDYPQRLFPWVPFSRSCVRISFAPAESEMIKQSCEEAKKAYMIGKQMLEYLKNERWDQKWNTSYVLKNSLLYCIEAFDSTSETDFNLWLKSLMKCHYEFAFQDFCPCYFMPTFSLPIEQHRNSFYPKYLSPEDEVFSKYHLVFYALYRSAISHDSNRRGLFTGRNFKFKMPVLNPITQHFDRGTLMANLANLALNDQKLSYMSFFKGDVRRGVTTAWHRGSCQGRQARRAPLATAEINGGDLGRTLGGTEKIFRNFPKK